MKCGHLNTGDKGQRYEVRFTDGDGKRRTFGWTNEADGGALVRSIKLHPVWHSPVVIDRKTGKELP